MMITVLNAAARLSAIALAILLSASAAAAGSKACLTGTIPEASLDLPRMIAARATIDNRCDCAAYDGSAGKTRADYIGCVKAAIKAAVLANDLRSQCAATMQRHYATSTCGRGPNLNFAPCISRKISNGKVKCVIKATTKKDGVTPTGACESSDSALKVSCPDYESCIDAADSNGDFVIDADDSGSCVPPAAATATQTPTATPTSTPTSSSTPTATSASVCGNGITEGQEQCDLGGLNGQAGTCCSASCVAVAAATSCDDGNACTANDQCNGSGVCAGSLIPLTAPQIDEIVVADTAAFLNGVTPIQVEGSVDTPVVAYFTDHSACHGAAAPTFHWVIDTPLVSNYTARGIRGYRASVLEIDADSIPNFAPNSITITLSITNSVGSDTKVFRAIYRNSALTIGMSTTCQTMQTTGPGCDIVAALAVLPGTPT